MSKLILIIGLAVIGWLWWKGRQSRTPMTAQEARMLLGIEPGADAEAIRAAHRRIIARVHPDAGGSEELARKINAARDLLLKSGVQASSRND
ncbi:J domain-containing protein [Sphingobium boeckii]|uniref:Preprotein translocase subunit Sec63 n=1 Tax=Sphingobium boeckii TaxID=1082345 RepID=A0A7W9EE76_9SPHN|nr:J domain-containing protein [Sphingobium boeckii]MBB5684381.1 preprotein translocase subunit Sec63 [Sphingobium boeckii]